MRPILVKGDDIKVEQRPNLIMASYGWHGSQWINNIIQISEIWINFNWSLIYIYLSIVDYQVDSILLYI